VFNKALVQPMPNVPLAYVSVYRRMSSIFHTLACASTIRYSLTGPLSMTFRLINLNIMVSDDWLLIGQNTLQ
jgi:hypothetical protein